MNEDEVFKAALQLRHQGLSQAEVDSEIAAASEGKYKTMAELQTGLHRQDMAGQGTAVEAFGGAAMPFLDRIGGALDAVGTVLPSPGFGFPTAPGGVEAAKAAYTQGRDIARDRNAQFAFEHPRMNLAARVAGGVGGVVTGGAALKGLGLLSEAATAAPSVLELARTGAVAGAGMGALQGLSDTPDLTDAPQATVDALEGGAGGAVAGALFGGATKPVMALAGRIPGFVRGLLPDFVPGSISREEAQIGNTARLAGSVLPENSEGIVSRLERSRPGEITLGDADRGVALDVSLRRAPTRAEGVQSAMAARSDAGGPALAGQVEQAAGVPGANAVEAQAAVQAARAPFRAATYKVLEDAHPEVIRTPKLDEALALPEVAGVVPDMPAPGMPDVAPLSFQRLQTALRLLRQKQEALFSGRALGDPIPVKAAADALEQGMEESMPMFRAANRGWAESAQALEGFDAGRKALGKDARVIAQELADLGSGTVGEEARNAYRLAALDQYASRLRNLSEGRNAGLKALRAGDQALESRLRVLFGNTEEMDRFFQSAQAERWLKSTQNALDGSKTQGRQAVDATLFGPRTAGGRLWRKLASWVQRDANAANPEADRMVDFLTARGSEMQRNLGLMTEAQARAAAARGALPGQAATAGLMGGTREGRQGALAAGVGATMFGPNSIKRLVGWDTGDSQ